MVEYEYYDWNNLITGKDRESMCHSVSTGIDEGKFWTNSPKYQTNWNVFQDFTDLKMSFLWSCFRYLGREVQIKNVQSWSFRTSLKHVEDRDKLWHHHWHDQSVNSVSGVYYARLPVEADDTGTEFAPEGPEAEARHMEPPFPGGWIIYNSKEWHRPGILKSEEPRFIVAADMMY